MSARFRIERLGPLATIQDGGRYGRLADGISASGPMDGSAYRRAGDFAGAVDGAGIEFTASGIGLRISEGRVRLGWDGGQFFARINDMPVAWPAGADLSAGDRLDILPGPRGNYGYLRFGGRLDLRTVLGSRATNTRAQLGGLEGRALRVGDELSVLGDGGVVHEAAPGSSGEGALRFIWGIHADRFPPEVRRRFVESRFRVTTAMDRMGVRLADESGVFSGTSILSLVSDPILCGDIQILGDGTPIVLMRDHQPTGGYPRIGTVISADLDRFAQIRAGSEVAFEPVTVDHAQRLLRSRR